MTFLRISLTTATATADTNSVPNTTMNYTRSVSRTQGEREEKGAGFNHGSMAEVRAWRGPGKGWGQEHVER